MKKEESLIDPDCIIWYNWDTKELHNIITQQWNELTHGSKVYALELAVKIKEESLCFPNDTLMDIAGLAVKGCTKKHKKSGINCIKVVKKLRKIQKKKNKERRPNNEYCIGKDYVAAWLDMIGPW